METEKPKYVWLSMILGILSFLLFLVGILDLAYFVSILFFQIYLFIVFLIGVIAVVLGFRISQKVKKSEERYTGRVLALIGITLGLLAAILCIPAIYSAVYEFPQRGIRSKVSRAKAEQQSIATALESYYIDNNCYPKPDYDENGKPILPHSLTTPTAFLTSLFHDPFKKFGKGYYEYGGGLQKDYFSSGWIVTSYGPDGVDGNSGVPGGEPLIENNEWTDSTTGDRIILVASPLTYDPTNGPISSGDIWRRGP